MYATGALANIRAYDPDPSSDPALEEMLRLRRLRDIVEAMQSRKATDKVQFYAKRWIDRHRAVKKIQGRMRGAVVRKASRIDLESRQDAATRLQASYRGRLTRDQLQAERAAQAKAAATLQARVRGMGTRSKEASGIAAGEMPSGAASVPLDDSGESSSAASASQWILVFGGGDVERQELCGSLAARCGGSAVDLAGLDAFAEADDSEAARVYKAAAAEGLRGAQHVAPLVSWV